MKYELINPSDMIFFDAESDKIAFLCCIAISPAYGYKNLKTDESGNMYLFGIEEEALNKELGMGSIQFCQENKIEINKCFQSFRYDSERTSMTKIVDIAKMMSVNL